MQQDKSVKGSHVARLAAALMGAGIPLPTQSDLDRCGRAIDRAVITLTARQVAAESSPAKKAEWASSVEKLANALAAALDVPAAIRCGHEEQIARLSSEEARDIPLPSDCVSVLRAWAKTAAAMRQDCSATELKTRKKVGPPVLPAIKDGTAPTELILRIAGVFTAVTGQAALAGVKSFRPAGKRHSPSKGGPFVDFVAQVWRAWSLDYPPSGATVYAALKYQQCPGLRSPVCD